MISRCIRFMGVAVLMGACGSHGGPSSSEESTAGGPSGGSGSLSGNGSGTSSGSATGQNSGSSGSSAASAGTTAGTSAGSSSGSHAGSSGSSSGSSAASSASSSGSSSSSSAAIVSTGDGGPCIEGTAQTGGTTYTTNREGVTSGGYSWQLWSNQEGTGSMTVYGVDAQFSAQWDNDGDFLAREGLVWATPQAYTTYGTITAQFAESRTGTGGLYSYIGIYGWSLPPNPDSQAGCVEWYIVDDSFNPMPVGGGGSMPVLEGSATIDGSEYKFYKSETSGTGGNNCGASFTNWPQYYSIRQTARQCGQITISAHFNAWANLGMTLGNLQEAQIIVEAGGGDGTIDFTTASVTASQ